MRKLLFILALVLPAFGALPSNTVWEVRTAGSNNNGGCFISGASGTDRSQQNSAQIAYTDLIVGGTTTLVTSAAFPFSAAEVGNCIHIVSGSGCTTGWFQVVSVATVTATLDRSAGTAASTCTANLGGAIATGQQLATNMNQGHIGWMKADGVYSISTQINLSWTGSQTLPSQVLGYTATRGDNGHPTIRYTAGSISIVLNSKYLLFSHFDVDCNSQSACTAVNLFEQQLTVFDVKAYGASTTGFLWNNSINFCISCYSTGNVTGFNLGSNGRAFCFYCVATANTTVGFITSNEATVISSIAANNTGASTDGFNGFANNYSTLYNNVSYGNGRHGFNFANSVGPTSFFNNVAVNNGGYGVNSSTMTFLAGYVIGGNNAFGNNALGARNNWTALANDVTLTADPFTNGASNVFTLNTTSGGGAALRAAGFPGALQAGGTGYLDIGALQSQAVSSTGSAVGFVQ